MIEQETKSNDSEIRIKIFEAGSEDQLKSEDGV